MAMRRSRSLSLFQPSFNSTAARLEGAVERDIDIDTKESIVMEPVVADDYDYLYGSEDEEEEVLPNGQTISREYKTPELLTTDLEFVKALKLCASVKDLNSYKKTINKLKFDKIDYLKDMSEAELRTKFDTLLKTVGKFRTFYSAVHDMEVILSKTLKKKNRHPEKPSQPLQAHLIYMKEMIANGKQAPPNQNFFKWASEMYNQLSVREKSYYIKEHEKLTQNYSRQLEEFYETYPDERPPSKNSKERHITPFNLFFDEFKLKLRDCKRADALLKWKNLPVKTKISYIKRAYQYQTNEANDSKKVTISMKEKMLLEGHNGKPEKPPTSIYRMYIQEKASTPDTQNSYKTLTKAEKQELRSRLNGMVRKYEKDMMKYIKKLPEDAKKIEKAELDTFISKYESSKEARDKSQSRKDSSKRAASMAVADTHEGEVIDSVSKKKKKTSKSVTGGGEQVEEIVNIKTENKKSPLENAVVEVKTKPKTKENKLVNKVAPTDSEDEVEMEVLVKQEGSKKKNKKLIKEKQEFTEVKPPKTLFKYFVSINTFDSLENAKIKYRNLTKSKKKKIEQTYNDICESYIARLRQYLSSLKESDMKAFVQQMEQNKTEEDNTDEGLTSSGDDSDGSDSE